VAHVQRQNAIGDLYYADNHKAFPEFVVVAVDPAEPGPIAARALSVPFTWEGDPDADLPVDGWDGEVNQLLAGLVTTGDARLDGRAAVRRSGQALEEGIQRGRTRARSHPGGDGG
jgi:hypothetical protein